MKEDKFIDSLFDAAKKEPPKSTFESVSVQFSSTVTSTNWWLSAKSAAVGNIYLNSIISAVVLGSLGVSMLSVNASEETKDALQVASEMSYSEWTPEEIAFLEKTPGVEFDLDIPEMKTSLAYENDAISSPNKNHPSKSQRNEVRAPQELSSLWIQEIPTASYEKYVNCEGVQKLEVMESYYKHNMNKNASTQLHCSFDKNATKMETEEFLYYLEMNGINVDLRAKYDKYEEIIKKLEIQLSDNEGYIQRVISIGFDVIEFYWKIDVNGYPYDLKIAWDNGDLIDVDLTDQRVPLYKYVDRD